MEETLKKAYIFALRQNIARKQAIRENLGIHFDEVMYDMDLQRQIDEHNAEIERILNTGNDA